MKKFFEKFFGAKLRSTKKPVGLSKISDAGLEIKLKANDIDFIIAYLKDGGDINRPLTIYERGAEVSHHEYETVTSYRFPVDLVTNEDIKSFMRRQGAISSSEYPQEEIKRLIEKRWRQEEEAEKKELAKKIKDYESSL